MVLIARRLAWLQDVLKTIMVKGHLSCPYPEYETLQQETFCPVH